MKKIFATAIVLGFLSAHSINGQVLKRMGENVKRKLENKANDKVNREIDEIIDGKPGNKKANKNGNGSTGSKNSKTGNNGDAEGGVENGGSSNQGGAWATFSKFDFIPGNKVLAFEDFSQDPVGDFPARWNTNASGEVVTAQGQKGKWLKLSGEGAFNPEFVNTLPQNFTLEFDVLVNPKFSYYSQWLSVAIGQMTNPKKNYTIWGRFGRGDESRTGFIMGLHPTSAGGQRGQANYEVFAKGTKELSNELEHDGLHNTKRPLAHVAIWRQGQRLRVYVNEYKIFDLPRAMAENLKPNSIVFGYGGGKEGDAYLITNLRLAESQPAEARNKLVSEGRVSTTGILFDFQSATIKPESHNVIKEIAEAMTENPDIKVQIIGHTSNDGDAAANLELSKKRAEAVKQYLVKNFSVAANRLTTDGKGGTQLIDKGTTPEAKANNRRVEFIKQ